MSAGDVLFMDTMRLSLCRKVKEASPPPLDSSEQTSRRRDSSIESTKEKAKTRGFEDSSGKEIDSFEIESRPDGARQVEQVPRERTRKETEASMEIRSNSEGGEPHFRGMRPTSWSPPPGKPGKHRYKINNSESTRSRIVDEPPLKTSWSTSSNPYGSSKVEIGGGSGSTESNVYKITVSPRASPLVHRLQIGPTAGNGSRRTSILINGDAATAETSGDNKVTISVGGEDSVYNPTVISVNSENPPRIKSSGEKNRTLVILDNYKSNIVVASSKEGKGKEDTRSRPLLKTIESVEETEQHSQRPRNIEKSESNATTISNTSPETTIDCEKRTKSIVEGGGGSSLVERNAKFHAANERTGENSSKVVASLSKEALISKLLEDSLRKARENGEILDEDSGEAILKILKQSLLKSKEYEGSESTLEANYSRASSLNSEADFISTNLFLEENPYEVIKEPIYEEIPDEPPPLPLSPPPTEDYIKDRIYFGDIDYYRKSSSDQFLGSYLADNVYKKSNNPEDLGVETYLSKSPEDFFKKMSTSPEEGNISSKFELLNFLMDTKDRAISIEEEEDEDDEDEEDTEGDLEALYEQKETSLGDLSSKSSQISNVSDSSEECNIILTSSSETSKVSFYIYIYIYVQKIKYKKNIIAFLIKFS